ncbi:MAG: glycosyltransferase family 2 protein [Chitinophagaceae bacterium]
MTSLSAIIITYNEEENILRSIRSAIRVADEVVVVDSFSNDNTRRICIEEGVNFIEHAFTGYGPQKNFAVDQSSSNYVLNLDADEFLSENLIASILEEKQLGFRYDAYTMNRLNRYRGQWIRHGSWYPDKKLRLYNREKGQWSDKPVHEDVEMQPGTSKFHLSGDLQHFAYDSEAQHEAKNEKYSSLSARFMFENGIKANPLNLIINPMWAFFRSFFVRLGFLDGFNGFIISKNIAKLTYLKMSKLLTLQKTAVSSQ